MSFKIHSTASLACIAFLLTGCTLVPIKKIQPMIAPPSGGTCPDEASVHLLSASATRFGYLSPADLRNTGATAAFGYLLPTDDNAEFARSVKQARLLTTFTDYHQAVQDRVSEKLGSDLASDPVVKAFTEVIASVSGEAQLDAQIADGTTTRAHTDVQNEYALIKQHKLPAKLKHTDLKSFANKVYALQFKHSAVDYTTHGINSDVATQAKAAKSTLTQTDKTVNQTTASAPQPKIKFDDALVAYLKAYYDGKFYDRMGTAVSKPQLPNSSNLVSSLSNFSVPDSEIVAAETVLLEFLMDTIDPTPVMGNTACPIPTTSASASCNPPSTDPKTTTYYPGNSSNQPTALTVGLAKYIEIPASGCGITTENAWVLKTLADGASDEAGTVGGLVANTAGGLGVSLGAFGKISIGDNATLSDLAKTAASEFALRATLLASYFSLYHVSFIPFQLPSVPALVPSPTSLTFTAKAGTVAPSPQTITITNPGSTSVGWTATSNAAWLTAPDPATVQAKTNASVSISVKPDSLAVQTYTGAITLAPTNGTAPSVSIPVTFTVSKQ